MSSDQLIQESSLTHTCLHTLPKEPRPYRVVIILIQNTTLTEEQATTNKYVENTWGGQRHQNGKKKKCFC